MTDKSMTRREQLEAQAYQGSISMLESQLTKANERIELLRESLESIACLEKEELSERDYWLGVSHPRCIDVLVKDTELSREALAKDDEMAK